jgi:hypothetical protein
MSGWVDIYGDCWVLWTLCVFGCISFVITDSVCIRDCNSLGLCAVGEVDYQQVVSV